ncbi:MAG: hypothetical protein WC641_07950 [Patescibacteria group bacterium]
MDLSDLFSRFQAACEHEAQKPESKAAKIMAELQAALKNGETTGDKLRDHVILRWRGDPEIEKTLRGLQDRLTGKRGQSVLLGEFTTNTADNDHGGGFFQQHTQCDARLGILDGEQLDFHEDGWSLPTSVYGYAELPDQKVVAAKGVIKVEWQTALAFHGGPVPVFNPRVAANLMGHEYRSSLTADLVAGDDGVADWFERLSHLARERFMFMTPDIAQLCYLKLAVATGRDVMGVQQLKEIAQAIQAESITKLITLVVLHRKSIEQFETAIEMAFLPAREKPKPFDTTSLLATAHELGVRLRYADEVGLHDDERIAAWRKEFLPEDVN